MKILITGSSGQLGMELQDVLKANECERGPLPAKFLNSTVITAGHADLDVTDEGCVLAFLQKTQPDVVINCAAYTKVDQAESEEDLCYAINAVGAENLAKACVKIGAKYVLPSTESVFGGGTEVPFSENSPTVPKNVYGRSKLYGEQLSLKANPNTLILRTGWLYGYHGKNFVKSIVNLGKSRDVLQVVADQKGNPSNANNFCYYLFLLLDKDKSQIYHCGDKNIISRYQFAFDIIKEAKIDCVVKPCTTQEYPLPAPRSEFLGLDCSKLEQELNVETEDWHIALTRFLKHAFERSIL